MALETLKDLDVIGGFPIGRVPEPGWTAFHIHINDETNMIGFRIQNGPIKENGVNGCQIDTLVHAAVAILKGLNEKNSLWAKCKGR